MYQRYGEKHCNQSTSNDQHFISPHSIQTISSGQVRRITKLIINWPGDIVSKYEAIASKKKKKRTLIELRQKQLRCTLLKIAFISLINFFYFHEIALMLSLTSKSAQTLRSSSYVLQVLKYRLIVISR